MADVDRRGPLIDGLATIDDARLIVPSVWPVNWNWFQKLFQRNILARSPTP